MLAVLVAIALADLPDLDVHSDDPAETCPDAATVRTKLAARAGSGARDAQGRWALRYAVAGRVPTQRAAGAHVLRLDLRDPSGAVSLTRSVTLAGASCEAAAEVVAAIVERYFRAVGWAAEATPGPAEGAPAADAPGRGSPPGGEGHRAEADPPEAGGAVPVGVGPSAPPPLAARATQPVAPAGSGRGLAVRLGVGIEAARGPALAVALDAALSVGSRWELSLGALAPPGAASETLTPDGGRARLSSWPLRLAVRARTTAKGLSLHAGAAAVAAIEAARSEGIARVESRTRLLVGLGASAEVRLPLSPRWAAALEAAGYAGLPATAFRVEGLAAEVLAPPRLRGLVTAGMAYNLDW